MTLGVKLLALRGYRYQEFAGKKFQVLDENVLL